MLMTAALIEPIGIETISALSLYCIYSLALIEPIGIETKVKRCYLVLTLGFN